MKYPWVQREFDRRTQKGLPPLIDLVGVCYEGGVSYRVLQSQWIELFDKYPYKVIPKQRHHVSLR